MADVSKIKLPDNTEVNVKDSRISGVDSTPTSGSANVVTSGGVYTAMSEYLPISGGAMTGNLSIVKSSDASITITTDSSGSPALILVRGDQTDAYSDWKIINDGGVLCFKAIQSSTESESVRVGAGIISVLTGTSGSPEIRLIRGTTADSYVDWRIVNNGGSIEFQRSVNNTSTTMTRINTTGLIPYGTVTNNVSSLSLGSQDNKWSNIYSNNGTFSGDVAVTGNVSAANIPTYHTGTSDPSSSLGSDGDIYLKLSS